MARKTDNKKVIKAISLGLSLYMALSPVAVNAEEIVEAGANAELIYEEAESTEQTLENTVVAEPQTDFENKVAEIGIDVADPENTMNDTSKFVKAEINCIENEAIKEATDAIVAVDMTNVDDALSKVSDIVDNVIADEAVATELEAAADTLIDIYDAQAEIALDALTVISEKTDAVTVKEDGSVLIDWNAATEDVTKLYNEYQDALKAKEDAKAAKNQIEVNKNTVSDKVDEFEKTNIDKNIDAISASKESKNTFINDTIARVVEDAKNNNTSLTKGLTIDGTDKESADMYRFFVNVVDKGATYGCLTYYDSENKIILRKNFRILSDGNIDFDYIPKSEWVKGNANCKSEIFGNGGNYIAAYVGDDTSKFITLNKTKKVLEFNGKEISTLMRDNVQLNDDITTRNKALSELKSINETLDKAESALIEASKDVDNALIKYQEAVAMYKSAASLDEEIRKNALEKAKLEYVKAEVNAFRKQQELDKLKENINDSDETEMEEVVNADVTEKEETDNSDTMNIETVINNIAANLGVAPESVENLVVQTIIDSEQRYTGVTNNNEGIVALGERIGDVVVESEELIGAEVIDDEKEVVNNIDAQNETRNEVQNIVTIDENVIPLASDTANVNITRSWRLSFALALTSIAGILLAIVKKKDKDEEEKVDC